MTDVIACSRGPSNPFYLYRNGHYNLLLREAERRVPVTNEG